MCLSVLNFAKHTIRAWLFLVQVCGRRQGKSFFLVQACRRRQRKVPAATFGACIWERVEIQFDVNREVEETISFLVVQNNNFLLQSAFRKHSLFVQSSCTISSRLCCLCLPIFHMHYSFKWHFLLISTTRIVLSIYSFRYMPVTDGFPLYSGGACKSHFIGIFQRSKMYLHPG